MSAEISAAGPPVRDAATVVLVRRTPEGPQVLMGQRGAEAVFMPSKFVFPGGAVDADDLALAPAGGASPVDPRLSFQAKAELPLALCLAAIRELWEETGLALGARVAEPDVVPDVVPDAEAVPAGWRSFFAAGLRPNTGALRFIFRAVTPPGRPRRFDARFFLAEAGALDGDHDDFSAACGELGHLRWVGLAPARALPLPFITGVVLSELEAILADEAAARPVPFFHHDARGAHFQLL